ncbi:hypothetical protein [Pseudarthrobacter sp. N5]|uniref:hypothetical protein n=1 Tax=Pseudarthrobacter sp. N5 TaxID=3418416 RepID=UPI003CEC2E6C
METAPPDRALPQHEAPVRADEAGPFVAVVGREGDGEPAAVGSMTTSGRRVGVADLAVDDIVKRR